MFGKGSGVGYPPGGVLCSPPTQLPSPKMRAIACVIFVERDRESASNYPPGNYRMVLSTEHVQRRLVEPPRNASSASGTDSGERALPGPA